MSSTELRGGLFVADDALRLTVDLENRGHTLTAQDGTLLVSNGAQLTPQDRTRIAALRMHLLAIASYTAPEPRWS